MSVALRTVGWVPRRPDPVRLRHAKLVGTLVGLRDLMVTADPELLERHRTEWPEVWDRIEQAVDLAAGADT